MCRSSRRPERESGFTLVEVLIAVAVLAIALGALLRALGSAVDTAGALRERTEAGWVASNRLAIHAMRDDWRPVSVTSGEMREGGQTWDWTESVSQTPVSDYRRIDVTVRRPGGAVVLARLSGFIRNTGP